MGLHPTASGCAYKKTPHSAKPLAAGSAGDLMRGAPGGGLDKWGHTEPLVSGELVIQTSFPVLVTRART